MNDTGRRGARLLAAALLLALPLLAAAAADRLVDIETRLRGRPEEALQALQAAQPGVTGVERVELLVLRGQCQVRVADGDAVERTAQELDRLAADGREPLAAPAATLVRARWFTTRGPVERADRLLTEALAQLPATAPPRLRLRFVDAQARARQTLGKLDDAVRLYQVSVSLADSLGVPWRSAEQRSFLAYSLHLAKQVERAAEVNREALAMARASGDLLVQSQTLTTEGIIAGVQGRVADELRAMRGAIETARQAGAKRDAVLAMANLSDYYLKQHDYATALDLAREALPLAREAQDPSSLSVALTNAGLAHIALGRRDEGMALVREALMIEERSGGLTDMAAIQEELGLTLERAGHLREAWAALLEHRRLADEVFQRKQQQAVLELQEGFEAERRQRDLGLLQVENGLKEAALLSRNLQQGLWAVGATAATLVLVLVVLLLRRLRASNAELSLSNAQLQVATQRDPLTGLANRRHFQTVMQQSATAGGALSASLLLIDIDHFKRINDCHGHAAGDAVLVEVATRLGAAMREGDLTVRWGGEEFLVLVRGMPSEQVEALAERLLDAIGSEPMHHGGQRIAVTASIGFATFPLQPQRLAVPWEQAIDLVDTAMYLAKAHGRNRAYGVRALRSEEGGAAAAPAATLEDAWRTGRADLTLLAGPQLVGAAP